VVLDKCEVITYSYRVIKSFRHAGLKRYFFNGSIKGIQANHAKQLDMRLRALDTAKSVSDLRGYPGWKVHKLKGSRQQEWSMWVNGNWRLTFMFEGEDVTHLNYEDYHGE